MSDIICAIVLKRGDTYTVDNLIVFDNVSAIEPVKVAMGYDYLLPVDGSVHMGDIYDPTTDIFTRDGVRVFPAKTIDERLSELEQIENDTQLALIELASMIAGGDENG